MSDEPSCPHCKSCRSVVWIPNPNGGYMHHCNKCGEDWMSTKPEQYERNYDVGEDGL